MAQVQLLPKEGADANSDGLSGMVEKVFDTAPDSIPANSRSSSAGSMEGLGSSDAARDADVGPPPSTSHKDRGLIETVKLWVALYLWIGIFHFNTMVILLALAWLPHPLAVAALVFYATIMLVPVDPESQWGLALARFVSSRVHSHFPIKLVYEDRAAIDPRRAYVVALEPHSVLPIASIAFSEPTGLTPLKRIRTLGSSALQRVPLARHLWTWMGMAAVSRPSFARLLAEGTSCVVIPGGVQEILYMNVRQEVLFLKKRRGFIKMAITSGAPLVPAFAFNQRHTYKYWLPRGEWYKKLARVMKFAPLVFWGVGGGPVPFAVPLTIVMGKPLEVEQRSEPTEEQVTEIQGQFLAEMSRIYEKYKAEFGAKDIELLIL